jgi:carboxyl-terminal processing protease
MMKNTIQKVLSYVLVAAIASGTTLLCCFFDMRNDQPSKLQELQAIVEYYFIGEADTYAMEEAAASAMIEALKDRWSFYMSAEEYLGYQDTMANSYVGVGVTVQVRKDGTGLDVISVSANGPAESAGILSGDVLIAVDGTSLAGKTSEDARLLIRGEENTQVVLTVDRNGQTLEFTVTRRSFQVPVAVGKMLEDKIGLVTIENFDSRCAQETIAAIESLRQQGATALIFDVRNNPGGYKHEMVQVLDYLLPAGELFRSEDYRGQTSVDYSNEAFLDMPMAVLINGNSYSAAEFFAAALDEYDAAIVVGEKTTGKGYFQSTFQLSDGSAVNLSIGKYFTPKGVSLAGVGLQPQVEQLVDEHTAYLIAVDALDPMEDPQILAAVNALKSAN